MTLDSRIQRVRSLRDRLAETGTMVANSDGSTHDVRTVSISGVEGKKLRDWVIREQAAHPIEIGLGYGFSTLHMCEGLLGVGCPDAKLTLLDPFQDSRFANGGLQNLVEAGVRDLVDFRSAKSQILLPEFLAEGRSFDLAFVDGNHRFDYVFLDLFYLGQLLPLGSVILVDDYNLPGIERAVAFFLRNLNWTVEEASREDDTHTWVVLRTASEPDNRHFRYFVEF